MLVNGIDNSRFYHKGVETNLNLEILNDDNPICPQTNLVSYNSCRQIPRQNHTQVRKSAYWVFYGRIYPFFHRDVPLGFSVTTVTHKKWKSAYVFQKNGREQDDDFWLTFDLIESQAKHTFDKQTKERRKKRKRNSGCSITSATNKRLIQEFKNCQSMPTLRRQRRMEIEE